MRFGVRVESMIVSLAPATSLGVACSIYPIPTVRGAWPRGVGCLQSRFPKQQFIHDFLFALHLSDPRTFFVFLPSTHHNLTRAPKLLLQLFVRNPATHCLQDVVRCLLWELQAKFLRGSRLLNP